MRLVAVREIGKPARGAVQHDDQTLAVEQQRQQRVEQVVGAVLAAGQPLTVGQHEHAVAEQRVAAESLDPSRQLGAIALSFGIEPRDCAAVEQRAVHAEPREGGRGQALQAFGVGALQVQQVAARFLVAAGHRREARELAQRLGVHQLFVEWEAGGDRGERFVEAQLRRRAREQIGGDRRAEPVAARERAEARAGAELDEFPGAQRGIAGEPREQAVGPHLGVAGEAREDRERNMRGAGLGRRGLGPGERLQDRGITRIEFGQQRAEQQRLVARIEMEQQAHMHPWQEDRRAHAGARARGMTPPALRDRRVEPGELAGQARALGMARLGAQRQRLEPLRGARRGLGLRLGGAARAGGRHARVVAAFAAVELATQQRALDQDVAEFAQRVEQRGIVGIGSFVNGRHRHRSQRI
ncbi:hypothetical protein DM48_2883 [Burkholderia gladioli]|uniref:Uncharacterized protein n=1 Tax=Burkholderia gladioli TaxID=28095 RepID=A0AAW3F121_BURGA|nr:hypothetical protein [Burkholderia gladioli]KGC14617.1 hypothetical protein DM48_2883 [Burkholderia gladioli]